MPAVNVSLESFTELHDEYPVDLDRVQDDVPLAQRAVIVHQPEDRPTGQYCRNDHTRWPCRLYRWGQAVLEAAGWSGANIAALASRAAPGAWSPR